MTDDEIIESLGRENRRLTDDNARLRAGLEWMKETAPPVWPFILLRDLLAGADPRDSEQRRAIALGKWKPEPTPGQGRVG